MNAKAIAYRLSPIISNLIDPDYMGFVSGRQAPDTIRKIINVIHYVEFTKTPTTFLTLDTD